MDEHSQVSLTDAVVAVGAVMEVVIHTLVTSMAVVNSVVLLLIPTLITMIYMSEDSVQSWLCVVKYFVARVAI